LTITQTWTTSNSLDTKLELEDNLTKGLKAEVLTNYLPAKSAYGGKLNLLYKQPNIHTRLFTDLFKGPTATFDVTLGHEGFLIGAEGGYDVGKAAITKYALAAGYSQGSYAAAVTAGVLNLADGVRLMKQRAERMVELYPKGYGLAAIVGLTEKQVSALVEEAYTAQNPVYVGNINAPRQIVIAGSNEGMNKVLEAARKSGARKAVRLDVSEPSHCKMLQPVADTLTKSLQALHLHEPKLIYVANVTGRALRTQEAIAEDLATNIAHGVRWYDATTVLKELGCRLFLEMPPGHVLTELGREAFSGVRTLAVGETSFTHTLLVAGKGKLQKPT